MAIDPSIILAGRAPDIIGSIDAGNIAGQRRNEFVRTNALNAFLQESGPGIMSGDRNALAGFARFDPVAAMGVQDQRQQMAIRDEQMQMARDQVRVQAQQQAAAMTAEQRAQEAQRTERVLSGASSFYAQGDQAGYASWLQQNQLDPAQYPFEQFPAIAAMAGDVLETLNTFQDMNAPAEPAAPQSPIAKLQQDLTNNLITQAQYDIAAAGLAPAGTNITIDNVGNSSAFGKKADEEAAARFGGYVEAGSQATELVGDLQALQQLAPMIGETGTRAQVMLALGPIAEAVGLDIEGLDAAQAYQGIVDRLAPAMRPPGAGATSDFDARQFLSSLPSLGRTPEGNAIIQSTLQALLQHRQEVARIAQIALRGQSTWQTAEEKIRTLGNPYEAFNAYLQQQGSGVQQAPAAMPGQTGPAGGPTDQGTANLPVVSTDAHYSLLPPGAEFVDENGVRYRKPGGS
jgi:hypothetical protein